MSSSPNPTSASNTCTPPSQSGSTTCHASPQVPLPYFGSLHSASTAHPTTMPTSNLPCSYRLQRTCPVATSAATTWPPWQAAKATWSRTMIPLSVLPGERHGAAVLCCPPALASSSLALTSAYATPPYSIPFQVPSPKAASGHLPSYTTPL